MAGKANPRRYSRAVFEIAQESKELDRWLADLRILSEAVDVVPFLDALESPKITAEQKTRLLKEVLGKVNPLAINLALLLVSRSIIRLAPEIAAEYKNMLDNYRGIAAAEVVAAVPLDDKEKENIKKRLSELTGAQIEIETKSDPDILGGIIARVGGSLLDGSTRSKLAALKKQLESSG